MSRKVKSIQNTQVNYSMENPSKPDETEWIESNSFVSSIVEYDLHGNTIKTASYSEHGGVHELFEYTFDEQNRLAEEICYLDEDEVAEHKFISWDGNKRVSEKITYQEGGENIVHLSYNEAEQLIERRVVDQDNDLQEKETFEYENTNLVSEKMFDEDEKLIYEKKYSYNEKDLLAEYEYSSQERTEYVKVVYSYHEDGKREKVLRYNWKQELIMKTIHVEDENGNVVEVDEEDRQSKKITRLTYDDAGNQIKQEEFDENDILVTSVERTYDADNNLMEVLVYTQNPEDDVRQMYATKYEYKFFKE